MSSTAPTKNDHSPNSLASKKGIIDWLKPFLTSSVGTKVTVAITGTLLTGFVIAHLVGNFKVFAGPESINAYAKFLKDQGPLLWIARGGLLTIFILHLFLALKLKKKSVDARPVKYVFPATIQADFASRTMPWTGSLILAFAILHLAHYTFCCLSTIEAISIYSGKVIPSGYDDLVDANGLHDVYTMVVHGFKNPLISLIYIAAQCILFIHLKHGIKSVFQTLGLNTPRMQPFAKRFAMAVAGFIVAGNIGIVVGVWTDQVPVSPAPRTTLGASDAPMPPNQAKN